MFEWKRSNACVGTYTVLQSKDFLNQFTTDEVSFEKADTVKLGTLPYFPKTTNNPDIIQVLSFEIARKFLTHLTKVFTAKKENDEGTSQIIAAVAAVFADKDMTIMQLAEVVDARIKFPDEG